MTFNQFKSKWLGGRTDIDGVFGYQCVDLIKQYAKDVYGITPGAWGNAIAYWRDTKHPLVTQHGFKRLSASVIQQAGDILVIDTGNDVGHIGIAVDNWQMMEQNGGAPGNTGTGADAIRIRPVRTLGGKVVGILRPPVKAPPTPQLSKEAVELAALKDSYAQLDAQYKSALQQLDEVRKALEQAQNKPPEKIVEVVEKIVEVEKPVKEPLAPRRALANLVDWVAEQISKLRKDK